MRIKLFTLIISIFASSLAIGQNAWSTVETKDISNQISDVIEHVSDYGTFHLDVENFKKFVATAPEEFSGLKGLETTLPMPDGSIETIYIYDSKITEDGLLKKFPSIQNFKFSNEDKTITGRFALSQIGFSASVTSPKGKIYIDRFSDDSDEFYASYYTDNYNKSAQFFPACGVTSADEKPFLEEFNFDNSPIPSKNLKTPEGDVALRTYRLAIAATGEFSQQKGGNLNTVLMVINESVMKLNEIFEQEVAIRFLLIEDNDKIIHLNADTDPYFNGTTGVQLIGQNTNAIGNIIPFNEWDLGHVYTSGCTDVGGIASLQSVCGPNKGAGVTCHYSQNLDIITTRVASHELGHQFGASHSFNHCDGENESPGTAFEPGSGHTIMSYAGLCGPTNNIANAPFIYFHGASVEQMINFSQVGNGNSCAEIIETTNTYPTAIHNYGDDLFYIPLETPFQLEGEYEDPDNDVITYSWEEFDLGPLVTPGEPVLDAPQFVSEVPNSSAKRILPDLSKILTGNYDKTEVIPFYEKDMTWRLTVRDNNTEAGGADWVETRFIATTSAGPFVVTYPNMATTMQAGELNTITWDVANTDGELVNCQHVNILLSEDGGQTYPHVLAQATPNDGSQDVFIPEVGNSSVRVWIEASDNIFFDISDQSSNVAAAVEPTFSVTALPNYQEICLPETAVITLNTDQFLGFSEEVTFDIASGLPPGATFEFSENPVMPGTTVELSIDASSVENSSVYDIVISAVTETRELEVMSQLDLVSGDFSDLAVLSPAQGESNVEIVKTFTWAEDTDADTYIFELSNNPDFTTGTILVVEDDLTEESFELEQPLDRNDVYFWRVTGINRCGDSFTTPVSAFSSETLTCVDYVENETPISLPSSGTPTTILESVIVANGQVSDVNITLLKGTHTNVKDLRVSLRSPAGTTVSLWDKRCAGSTSFNAGFDSESPADIQCPMLNAAKFAPEGDLKAFNGEDLLGTWELVIEDLVSGNGGKIDDYILNICSNAAPGFPPELDRNNGLKIAPGGAELINQGRLLVVDGDNDDNELTYTLVEVPQFGILRAYGEALTVGQSFTQSDLNNNGISYVHESGSTDPENDNFVFVVDDSEGGWIGLTNFDIEVDLLNNNTEEELFDYQVEIFPNPSNGQFLVDVANVGGKSINVEIVNILGQVVVRQTRVGGDKMEFDLSNQASGTYFVRLDIEGNSTVHKVTIK